MNKEELINRWKTAEGKIKLKQVIECLETGTPNLLEAVLQRYCGRWDLRGAPLSKVKKERNIEVGGHSLVQKIGTLKLKSVSLTSVDFSYAELNYSWWEKCQISNCLFEETKAKEIRVIASDFIDCIFKKADLNCSYINENIGSNSGSFKRVQFLETNLKECLFYFPVIEDCVFDNCNLEATNFNGSRFGNCKFIGLVDSPWFKGYPVNVHKSLFGFFNRINPKDFPNPMKNIDFSEAELIGVSFINGIDLSKCIFPNDPEKYVVVKNLHYVFSTAKRIVNESWNEEDRRKGHNLIDNIYFSKDRQNQYMDLLDKNLLTEDENENGFGERFFKLIQTINANQ
ncbi:pentapeptide repeat-containing protein [Chryseolinea sp. H1M3-3]|uniref:pentapeptide repeat-containing protein n=1 Tax=Chryseolinea sp. H1M3-3 TaxID=3034144 RepID=UPI0023EC4E05|nr:pentapeptide repeat-containing protein [Chryseolinea sp. H1M3-3]